MTVLAAVPLPAMPAWASAVANRQLISSLATKCGQFRATFRFTNQPCTDYLLLITDKSAISLAGRRRPR